MLEQGDITFLGWWLQLAATNSSFFKLLVVGFLGSCVRIAVIIHAGGKASPAMIFAQVTTGTVLCVTTAKALTASLHLPADYTIGVGFVVGTMGMAAIEKLGEMDILGKVLNFLIRGLSLDKEKP